MVYFYKNFCKLDLFCYSIIYSFILFSQVIQCPTYLLRQLVSYMKKDKAQKAFLYTVAYLFMLIFFVGQMLLVTVIVLVVDKKFTIKLI